MKRNEIFRDIFFDLDSVCVCVNKPLEKRVRERIKGLFGFGAGSIFLVHLSLAIVYLNKYPKTSDQTFRSTTTTMSRKTAMILTASFVSFGFIFFFFFGI